MGMDTGWVDAAGDIGYINTSGLSSEALSPQMREIASQLTEWTRGQRARTNRSNLFMRDKYASPDNPYEQIRVARRAVADDDIVGTCEEVTSGLLLQEVRWESPNADVADIFNQISAGVDLDTHLRIMLREEFTESQTVTASWWAPQSFTPRKKKKRGGAARRKAVSLYVPDTLITLDTLKVVPVGRTLFGEQRLAWNATEDETDLWSQGLADATMTELFSREYRPNEEEAAELDTLGVNPDRLLELRPDRVWRHTRVKSSYQKFPDIRLRGTFRHLDLKQQLMEADRVNLVGAANYILLVKKGTDAQPAVQEEVANLKENFRSIAKLPVIVSDHRLEIEIITPKNDLTLQHERYDLLDRKIAARALGVPDAAAGDGENGGQMNSRFLQRTLESRRLMLRRTIEKRIRDAIWDHPRNREALSEYGADEKPSLAFTPRNIQVDNDAQMIQAVVAARQARELSRESFLEYLGYDQEVEAQRREHEAEHYDDVFKTAVPYNAPANGAGQPGEPSAVAGARGGRPAGGGQSPKSVKGSVRPQTSTGAPSKS